MILLSIIICAIGAIGDFNICMKQDEDYWKYFSWLCAMMICIIINVTRL